MNKRRMMRILLIGTALCCASFAPIQQDAAQTASPLISIDMDALTQQIKDSVSTSIRQENEALIAELGARIDALETQVAELQRVASLPTSTPAPQTVEPTTGPGTPTVEPTRTPNPSGYDCVATRLTPYFFGQFSAGAEFVFSVQIENVGTKTWGDDVTIKFVDGLKAEKEAHYAYALPVDSVAPGETVQINIPMVAPTEKTEESGKYESLYALTNGEENFCEFVYAIYTP